MDMLGHALAIVLDPYRMVALVGGVLIGLVIGVIPGLGGVIGLAILIPFTYGMDPYAALALLVGMHAVTTTSDLIPAILFGVPGTVGASATVMDGHALAKLGRAGQALGAGYSAALFGGLFGAVLLALCIPIIRPLVLFLASPELLSFAVFGLSMVGTLSGKAPLKGLAGAAIGLMIAMIGFTPQTGTMRWTFGSFYLWDHLPLVPFTLGLFAVPEMIELFVSRGSVVRDGAKPDFRLRAQYEGLREVRRNMGLVLRSSWVGTFLGAVPGIGSASIDWIVYGQAQRFSKNAESFGKGDIRGVIAPEAANSAKEGGALLPTIAFGVPGGAGMAVLLSAFLLHGLVPGPEMLGKHLDLTYSIVWSLTLANVIGTLICLSASGLFARLSTVRAGKLVPLVIAFIVISAYQGSASWGDLYSLAIFGLVGWCMKENGWPRPPMMLGFVLGALFERYFFISTQAYGWEWVLRPVVLAVFLASAYVIYGPLKTHLGATIRDLRKSHVRHFQVSAQALFTLAVIAVIAAALWTSTAWPHAARIVPQIAGSAALFFALATLVVELFAPRAAEPDTAAGMSAPRRAAAWIVANRPLRFFLWFGGFLVLAALVGLLPALFVLVLAQSRFEFRQSWAYSVGVTVITVAFIWICFGYVFNVPWPQSYLGDQFPALRFATGLV
ncbi:tripartite tricarboxylate transporter permease [Propylenella binzhouense]|uniref:DUF112 domain-containing protein n=1 Tax=Propylenella binzhouense TaxID=2555902 RepID=A0A964WTP1_9HYPH|nr:tripartite tricarboxylate transporter permease [Propylenella binzhouense]MYZ48186.1 hypothetical protein [Propylenella binzhouense]